MSTIVPRRRRVARLYIVVLAALALESRPIHAGTGLSFLEIPVGARESALGGAGAALVTGPTSAAYNPALLAYSEQGIAAMHTRHFGDTYGLFAGMTIRSGRLAVTPHYWGMTVPDIEYRIEPTRDPISRFDANQSAAGCAVAVALTRHLSAGATGRYLYQKIQAYSTDGWAFDAGLASRDVIQGLTAGLALQHFGQMDRFVSESPRLPTTVRGGAAYERAIGKYGMLLVTGELSGVRDHQRQIRGGIEYRAPGYVALRAGWVEGLEAQGVSLGVGFFIKKLRLDYAFIPFREELGEGHRFSFALNI